MVNSSEMPGRAHGEALYHFVLLLNFAYAGLIAYQKYSGEQEERYSRPVERSDELHGVWLSVPLPDDMRQKLNTQDPAPAAPYHALAISADGKLRRSDQPRRSHRVQ